MVGERGRFGTFNYDRWKTEPPIEDEESNDEIYWNGREWVKYGD
ncbi:hypothetical protein [Streptococcus uberis]